MESLHDPIINQLVALVNQHAQQQFTSIWGINPT